MKEPIVVEAAVLAPYGCATCGSTKGPLLDWVLENALGRVYTCKLCARMGSRAFGFAPGKKLDELSDAAAALEQRDQELAKLVETISELRLEAGTARVTAGELREQLQVARGKLQTTQHLAAQLEQGAHELVEAVAPRAPVEVAA
jgi:hypothetical protein